MTPPTLPPVASPTPLVIGNAFVKLYYCILHQSPEMAYKFYKDSSIVNRPNSDGEMTSVTTMLAINNKIMSLNLRNCFTEIETVDSQMSYQNGVLCVVTGTFTGQDNVQRRFAQSFFLAPQENGGYFVLNDVFRYLNETDCKETNQNMSYGGKVDDPKEDLVTETQQSPLSTEDNKNKEVLSQSQELNTALGNEVVIDPAGNVEKNNHRACGTQDYVPEKSYVPKLWKVKVLKQISTQLPAVTSKTKVTSTSPQKHMTLPPLLTDAPETNIPATSSADEGNNNIEEELGYSIYVGNLSLNATAEQIEKEFKKFGSIKPGGVQVKKHMADQYCFGFVEFWSLESVQAAIKASPVTIGGHQVLIREKRSTRRVVNGVVTMTSDNKNGNGAKGPFKPGKGFIEHENFRGGSDAGYRRIESVYPAEYTRRGYIGYQQRAFQDVNGIFNSARRRANGVPTAAYAIR